MVKKSKENSVQKLILTGKPGEDFGSFLKSKEKPYDFGLQLIKYYTRNATLIKFLIDNKDNPKAKKLLIKNIKIISRKW